MNDNPDVFDLLAEELSLTLDMNYDFASTVVNYLEQQGFLDYDQLKEIYLFGVDEE